MDAIESLDWGVYSHFDFEDQKHTFVKPFMQVAYYISSYHYLGVAVLAFVAILLFLLQQRRQAALVSLVSVAASIGLIEGIHRLIPRRRPENAAKLLGADQIYGSYPSAGVFLFMLVAILIGLAIWDRARVWQRITYVVIAGGLTVWVCMSQFFLSLHFLTDVIGGLVGATLVGWIAWRCLEPLPPKAD